MLGTSEFALQTTVLIAYRPIMISGDLRGKRNEYYYYGVTGKTCHLKKSIQSSVRRADSWHINYNDYIHD